MRDILDVINITGKKIYAVLENVDTGEKKVIQGGNIVTDQGDKYYAQSAAGISPTKDFDAAATAGLRLGTNSLTPEKTHIDVITFLAGSNHTMDATYETVNDGDTDNTGGGVDIVTWRYSYTTAEGNVSGIYEGAIVDDRTTPTAALTRFVFAAAFTKTSTDTLKVFINHTFSGV